jgi:chromosome segregation ATPase
MKKYRVTVGVLALFLGSAVFFGQGNINAQTENPNYDKISQDAERNRELLEIWKDHVKTLTKERDQATQELERVKARGADAPAAQFGGMESMPLPLPAETMQQIDSLQSEVSRLQLELQNKTSSSGGTTRELQMQYSALQKQVLPLKQEAEQARNDKERALQEKEKALSQVEQLNQEVQSLRANQSIPAGDDISRNVQKAYDIQKKRYEDLQKRFHELETDYESSRKQAQPPSETSGQVTALQDEIASLQDENRQLKADLEKHVTSAVQPATGGGSEIIMRQTRELQRENEMSKSEISRLKVVEKELGSTRAYFMPIMKELQEKIDKMKGENTSLAAEVQRARDEAAQSSKKAQLTGEENKKIITDLDALNSEKEELASKIQAYQAQLQVAAADKEKYLELQTANASYQQDLAAKDAELKRLNLQAESLEKAAREMESRERDNLKSVEKYQAALNANLADMKNLKSNFEAYLESLVAGFDERQR